jgi:hypothetical protein
MLPGVIFSTARLPERESCGSAHSGPVVRGKEDEERDHQRQRWISEARRGPQRSRSVGERPTRLKPTSVATKIHTHGEHVEAERDRLGEEEVRHHQEEPEVDRQHHVALVRASRAA